MWLAASLPFLWVASAVDARAEGPGAAAPAAPAPRDTIYLKTGGILRGTIVDAIPGEHARIQLATGEVATVQWGDVLRVEHATDSAPAAETPPKAPGDASVWVHLEGSDDAQLEQDSTGDGDWTVVCSAPCDRRLSTAFDYRINGAGLKASGRFSLHGAPGSRETVRVAPASSGWFVIGVIAAPVGGIVAYVGIFLVAFGTFGYTTTQGGTTTQQGPSAGLAAAGWTMIAVGGTLGIGGLVALMTNWRSGVKEESGAPPTSSSVGVEQRLPAPTWRERTVMDRVLPGVSTVPVLSLSF